MLPYATPAIAAQLDIGEERERDTLPTPARQHLGSPARVGAHLALAICEVEAGLRSPLQLEQHCHLSLWPKLSARLRRSGGPAVPVGSLVRVVAQEHVPRLAEVTVLVRRGRAGGAGGDAAGWGQGPMGAGRAPVLTAGRVWRGPRSKACARPGSLAEAAQTYPQTLRAGLVAATGLAIVRP
jgi:hypothetical protein